MRCSTRSTGREPRWSWRPTTRDRRPDAQARDRVVRASGARPNPRRLRLDSELRGRPDAAHPDRSLVRAATQRLDEPGRGGHDVGVAHPVRDRPAGDPTGGPAQGRLVRPGRDQRVPVRAGFDQRQLPTGRGCHRRPAGRHQTGADQQPRGRRRLLRDQGAGLREVPRVLRRQRPHPQRHDGGQDAGLVPGEAQEPRGVPGGGVGGERAAGRPVGAGPAQDPRSDVRLAEPRPLGDGGLEPAAAARRGPPDRQHHSARCRIRAAERSASCGWWAPRTGTSWPRS